MVLTSKRIYIRIQKHLGNFTNTVACLLDYSTIFTCLRWIIVQLIYFYSGDVYDGMESKTLDIPEKKRYKRPASGVTRHARSASAEVINRDEEDMMGDTENITPARRRPRRKRTHGEFILCFFFKFLSKMYGTLSL